MIPEILEKQDKITSLCSKYNVKRLSVIGSALDTHFDPASSDIDLLVEFNPFSPEEHTDAYFGFANALESLFNRTVDLIEINAVRNPYLKESFTASHKQIYGST
jgi:hypothetical protein